MPTALIVEDEPEANRLLAMLVQIRGYATESALTGREALDLLRDHRPDVVFLDLMLPDTDGFEVCRAIKADPATSLIPVVVVTARLAEESRIRSFQHGALAFIPKPYTPDQVFQALAAAEDWRRELAQRGGSGEIRLDAGEEDFSRGIARLQGLLLARTPLEGPSAARIVAALRTIRDEVRAYADRHRLDRVATATYSLGDDRLTLSIRDEAGWSDAGDLTVNVPGLEPDLNRAFDETDTGSSGRETILTKHFAPPKSGVG